MKSIAEVTQLASQFDTDENLILVVDVEKKNIKKSCIMLMSRKI